MNPENSETPLEILENYPALNVFSNVEQKYSFFKKSINHYNFLQNSNPQALSDGLPPFNEILNTLCREIDVESLSSLEFKSISELFIETGDSYCLFLPYESSSNNNSFGSFPQSERETINKDKIIQCLPQKKFFLLAKLTHGNPNPSLLLSSLLEEKCECFLILSDGASKIALQVKSSLCDEMLTLMDQWILLRGTNIISSSEMPGMLEICKKPIPLQISHSLPKRPIPVLNVKSASIFLHNSEIFRVDEICVYGLVSTVSEVVQIKRNLIFLVEMRDKKEDEAYSFYILFKDEFLYWQLLLNPGSNYVFTALRVSIFNKGCGPHPVKVFVPCTTCRLWPQNYCQFREQNLNDFLPEERMKEELCLPNEMKSLNLASYQGYITDTKNATEGIYILDHQVRLHMFYNPIVHRFGHLRVGSFIQVHNVHFQEFTEHFPQIQLFCCMKSCIKVLEFSPLKTPPVLLDINSDKVVAFSHSRNIDWILHVKNWFFDNSSLLGLKNLREKDFIWNSFLRTTVSVKQQWNLLQEFFSTDHKCPFLKNDDDHTEESFPFPVSPSQLLEEASTWILQRSLDESSANKSTEEEFWEVLSKTVQGEKMLIGYISASSETGRLCLMDQRASIDITCQPLLRDATPGSSLHSCTTDCILPQKGTELTTFHCPFAHTWCLGQLILVKDYEVVLEKFIPSSNTENWVKYVQFSLEDVVVLNGNLPLSFRSMFQLDSACRESVDNESICTCQMFVISHKKSLMGHNLSTEKPAVAFTASGYFLANPFQLLANKVSQFMNKFPKSEELQDVAFDLEAVCTSEQSPSTYDCCDRVDLQFENSLAKYYDVLQGLGTCYLLVVRGNNPQAFSSFLPPSVVKKLRDSNSKYLVKIPENVIIHELSDWHLAKFFKAQRRNLLNLKKTALMKITCNIAPSYSIDDIISPSFSGDVVSLLPTKILNRIHLKNDSTFYGSRNCNSDGSKMEFHDAKLGLSMLNGRSIKLVLQDLKSLQEVVLYLNLEKISYPLGLITGAIVEFRLLKRILSKKNQVYCKFSAISSVRILASSQNGFLHTGSSSHTKVRLRQVPPMKNNEWGMLSLMFAGSSARQTFWTRSFVSQIIKLFIKTICTKCSSFSIGFKCSDKTCNNTQFKPSVSMRLLLDDGTGSCYASTWQKDFIREILGLSSVQWKDLINLIHSKWGQIDFDLKSYSYQDPINEENSVHHFVAVICNSQLVKQNWWMELKQMPILVAEDRFPFREIGFQSGKLRTRCLPFFQVEILSIQKHEPFDMVSF